MLKVIFPTACQFLVWNHNCNHSPYSYPSLLLYYLLHHLDQVAHLHAQRFGNLPQRLDIGIRVAGFDLGQVASGYRREVG